MPEWTSFSSEDYVVEEARLEFMRDGTPASVTFYVGEEEPHMVMNTRAWAVRIAKLPTIARNVLFVIMMVIDRED